MSKKTSLCLALLALFLLQSSKTAHSSTLENKTTAMLSLPLKTSISSVSLLINSDLELTTKEEQNQSEEVTLSSLSNRNSGNKFLPIHFSAKKAHDPHKCLSDGIKAYEQDLQKVENGTDMNGSEYRSLKKNGVISKAYIERHKKMGIDCRLITSSSQKTMKLTTGCIDSMGAFNKYSHQTKWTAIQKCHFELEEFGPSLCPTTIRNKNITD